MIRARTWLTTWLAEVTQRRQDHRIPAVLRQCVWCQNGLHGSCNGMASRPHPAPGDCLCPCPHATELRARP